MGDEAPAGAAAVLHVCLPREADVRVIRDGTPFAEARAAMLEVQLDGPGVYRTEARIDGRLWLLSNPVHMRPI
jgi:hypothetical protein